jgi:uncharacterized protein YebE (UPF0316 family)
MTITSAALLTALTIFILRVFNNGIGTMRLILMARQQRLLTVILAFFEALTFAVTVAGVATDLTNTLNLFAYCAGFAVGNYVGMAIESRFIVSYVSANVIAKEKGDEIAAALRTHGYGVTTHEGEGLRGTVTVIRSVLQRRDVTRFMEIVGEVDQDAFISVEEARSIKRGTIRARGQQPLTGQ